jgi:hypothetical protein
LIKDVNRDIGYEFFALHDFNMLGIQNGEVAKLSLKEKAIISNLRITTLEVLSLTRNCL